MGEKDFLTWLQRQLGLEAPNANGQPLPPLPKRDPSAPRSGWDKAGDFLFGMIGLDDPLAEDASPYTGAGALVSMLGPAALVAGRRMLRKPVSPLSGQPIPKFAPEVLGPEVKTPDTPWPVLDLNNTLDTQQIGDDLFGFVPGEQKYLPLQGGLDKMMYARSKQLRPGLTRDQVYESMAPVVARLETTEDGVQRFWGHRPDPIVRRQQFAGPNVGQILADVSRRSNIRDARLVDVMTPGGRQLPQPAIAHEQWPSQVRGDGFEVYHASPHKFDQFDINKIGTGEGVSWGGRYTPYAGRGMYTTESRPAFDHYKKQFTEDAKGRWLNAFPSRQRLDLLEKEIARINEVAQLRRDSGWADGPIMTASIDWPNLAIKQTDDYSKAAYAASRLDPVVEYSDPLTNATLQKMLPYDQSRPPSNVRSKRYKVLVDAPKEHFLDLGKSLDEQSQYVQDRLFGLVPGSGFDAPIVDRALFDKDKSLLSPSALASGYKPAHLSGSGLLSALDNLTGHGLSSEALPMFADMPDTELLSGQAILKRLGIPGTRFISRAGNHNTVVNDDKIMHILRVLGLAGAGTAASMASDDDIINRAVMGKR